MGLIHTAKDARLALGQVVYWDERGSRRYKGAVRSGVLTEVLGRNLCINGDWKWRTDLTNLRTTEAVVENG